jgi:conjugal transfer mating pair stabilization protein TraG
VVANSDVYLDWYKQNAESINSRGQTQIDNASSDVDNGKEAVIQARTDNDQMVTKEHVVMQDELDYQIHGRSGEKMQSTVPMMEQVHRDNFALMKQLGIMPQDHEFKGKFAEYNKPKSAFDFERPEMKALDQANQSVKDQSKNVLDEKDKRSKDIQHNVDIGTVSFKEYRDLKHKRTEEKEKMLKNPMLPPSLQ